MMFKSYCSAAHSLICLGILARKGSSMEPLEPWLNPPLVRYIYKHRGGSSLIDFTLW